MGNALEEKKESNQEATTGVQVRCKDDQDRFCKRTDVKKYIFEKEMTDFLEVNRVRKTM